MLASANFDTEVIKGSYGSKLGWSNSFTKICTDF